MVKSFRLFRRMDERIHVPSPDEIASIISEMELNGEEIKPGFVDFVIKETKRR